MKQVALVAILLTALFASAVRLPASACPISGPEMGKACKMGCCASKSCCADSQKNKNNLPSQPLVKNGLNDELTAIAAPVPTGINFSVQSLQVVPVSSAQYLASSAPRPALLCTFLI